ncbi:MAG: hypothetical protein F4137_07675 [Acidobacteria bacterium]|nr:hypothetical protein [Acidobacteriota bacterium]
MDAALLRRIDADSEVRQRGRSAFIRSAIEMCQHRGAAAGAEGLRCDQLPG